MGVVLVLWALAFALTMRPVIFCPHAFETVVLDLGSYVTISWMDLIVYGMS